MDRNFLSDLIPKYKLKKNPYLLHSRCNRSRSCQTNQLVDSRSRRTVVAFLKQGKLSEIRINRSALCVCDVLLGRYV